MGISLRKSTTNSMEWTANLCLQKQLCLLEVGAEITIVLDKRATDRIYNLPISELIAITIATTGHYYIHVDYAVAYRPGTAYYDQQFCREKPRMPFYITTRSLDCTHSHLHRYTTGQPEK